MHSIMTRLLWSSIALSLSVAALPWPQIADNADPSVVPDGMSADMTDPDPFPDSGQAAASSSSVGLSATMPVAAAATNQNDPSIINDDSTQDPVAADDSSIATPLTPDTSSTEPPAHPDNASSSEEVTQTNPPGELTGQLLGMSNCSGIFYNPKWDRCDVATGKITSKKSTNGKRQESISKPVKLSPFSKDRKLRRQVTEDSTNNAEHEHDPTILSGVAGIDDGAAPKSSSNPSQEISPPSGSALSEISSPSSDSGKREIQQRSPEYVNFWNTPFADSQEQKTDQSRSGAKMRRQAKSPGNNNFWNTPFELPQGQQNDQSPGGRRLRRQAKSPGNNNFWNTPFELPQGQQNDQSPGGRRLRRQESNDHDLRLQSGPLSGEDRNLDGAIPYMQEDGTPKTKRQGDQSPHVEVGPPGAGGARNIIINKRAQPDFDYVRPEHTGADLVSRRADVSRMALISKRQTNNGSSPADTSSGSQSGYLGELGAEEAAAARAGVATVPPQKLGSPGKRQDANEYKVHYPTPHGDGNHNTDQTPTSSPPSASSSPSPMTH